MIKNILQVLENTTSKFPKKVAYGDSKREVTYLEFTNNSKKIGTSIIDKINVTKSPIIIFVDKTVNCLETMMGIVYSGNFYSIVDTNSPKDRVENILKTLNPVAIITDEKNKTKLDRLEIFNNTKCNNIELKIDEKNIIKKCNSDKIDYSQKNENNINDCKILYYENLVDCNINQEKLDLVRDIQIDTDIMYILFTSGSTGVPKGTIISHRAVLSYIAWVQDTFDVDENTVWGSQTPFYFSMSITDVFTNMLIGGTLYVIPKINFSFPINLLKFMNEKKINTIYWVPSALCIVANLGALKDIQLPYLKNIFFAGEVMPVKQLNMWMKALPNCVYANLYGPTETTDICSYYVVDRKFEDNETLPIGKHCNNCNLFIVKEDGTEAKDGEQGELYARGSFLAYGYYGNEEKTKGAFVQNPLNKKYPEIAYKTGDIVKYNDKGELIYLSRKDYQIKHMGYRIELGEIEKNIYAVDEIILCVAVYDDKNSKIVLCYQGDILEDELAKRAEKLLLPYMRPNKYIKLNVMPYNANGKIDRKKLKADYCE